MAVNKDELLKKSSDELIATIVEMDAKFSEKPADAPAEKPAEAPAEKPAEKLAEKPAEKPAENQLSEGQNKKLAETEQRLSIAEKALADQRKETRKAKVEVMLNELADSGVPKAAIEIMRPLMLADEGTQTYKLSETDKDNKVTEKNLTLSECLVAVAQAYPLIELGETTVAREVSSGDTAPAEGENTEAATVKKYADEKKISFREAYRVLLAENKIKGVKIPVRDVA